MMARLILSAGIFSVLASAIAFLRRGFPSGSPPPIRAAMVISLMNLVKARPRLESIAAFLCLILCHLEWPDIDTPQVKSNSGHSLARTKWGRRAKTGASNAGLESPWAVNDRPKAQARY